MKTVNVKDIINKILVVISLFCLSLAILLKSPLNPFWQELVQVDSGVFKYVAVVMSKGGMPYRDVFDHKGPLIYIYNYLGQMISFYRGIWLIELLSMFSLTAILYKICRMFCKPITSILIIALTYTPFVSFFWDGNYTEEYAMPFIAGAVYIFLDFLLNAKITKLRLILCGASMACVLMLRPNMIGVWAVFAIAVLIKDIKQKEGKWAYFLGFFMIGFAIIALPICIWLAANGAFSGFIEDYIIFNFKYIDHVSGTGMMSRFETLAFFMQNAVILFMLPILIYLCIEKQDLYVNITYIICFIISLLLVVMAGIPFGHYGMTLIPLIAYPYARIFSISMREKIKTGNILIISMLLIYCVFGDWVSILKRDIEVIDKAMENQENRIGYYANDVNIVDVIHDNTNEDDKIMVLGNGCIIYVLSQRMAASKYAYQLPMAEISEDVLNEIHEDIEREKPKYIADVERTVVSQSLFPDINEYELILESETVDLYKLKSE